MRGWWQDLTDLVLPADCAGCGVPRVALCAECRAALCGAAPRRVRPVPEPRGLPVVHAAAPYGDAVRAVLLAHKERGALPLAGVLGEALAGAVRAALRASLQPGAPGEGPAGPVLLVPVPSARRAVWARGHDPVRRIALAAAGELRGAGVPASVLCALRQRRAVADQAGLNSRQRQANLAGALEVAVGAGRLLRDAGKVVVVDDLMTTGASLAEASRALGGVCGVHRVGDGTGGEAADDSGREAQMTAERQRRNRPSRGGRNSTPDVTENGRVTSGMARVNIIRAAVVAATPASFEINRN
ncbi:hypothetical protein GCM10010252_17820 [Streptomyces aureoverticillatus]|nr:hypothetical protein GCM10010252_17820 [Streptomyces aureoverticillatus]